MKIFTVKNDKGQAFEVDEDKISDAAKDGFLPVVSNGSQEHRVEYKDLASAEKDGYTPIQSAKEIADKKENDNRGKQQNSILRGVVQGATRGTSDEIAGGVDVSLDYGQRALNALGLASKSPGQVSMELSKAGFKGDIGPSEAKDIYTTGRNEERSLNKQAESDNPALYTAGNVAGSLLGTVSPTGMIADATLQGAGYSEADNLKDLGKDVTTGAAIGLGANAINKSGSKILEYLSNKFGSSKPAEAVAELVKNNAGTVGATAGAISHGPIGATTGYMAGKEVIPKAVNKLEPIINKFDEGFQYTMKNLPPKYKAIMDSAGTRGAQSQAVQHFLLGQRDQEYQELTKDSSEK